MSLQQLYQWHREIMQHFKHLGYWQGLNVAIYSIGVMVAQHCAPSRVAEELGVVGKADTVQRRLERFLDNTRIDVPLCCQAWSRWVLGQFEGERIQLWVDETKLGAHLSVMMVGIAYQQCCIPLAWQCYNPKAWPDKQVDLVMKLLSWVAVGLPAGHTPQIQADRGIGCSSALVQRIQVMGWHYLFRVQKQTKMRTRRGREHRLGDLIKLGETWSGTGWVFKKAGWIKTTIHLVWEAGYQEPWCLITNDPDATALAYAVRYWQEAGFRDLKSDGWQWQCSRIWTPRHADLLVLVMALAYALTLTSGTLALSTPQERAKVTKGRKRKTYSLFRIGLRYFKHLLQCQPFLIERLFRLKNHDLPSPPSPKSVGV